MTNADRIRSMSDEELSILLHDGCCRPNDTECIYLSKLYVDFCEKCWLEWLKEEAKDESEK